MPDEIVISLEQFSLVRMLAHLQTQDKNQPVGYETLCRFFEPSKLNAMLMQLLALTIIETGGKKSEHVFIPVQPDDCGYAVSPDLDLTMVYLYKDSPFVALKFKQLEAVE